MKHELSSIPGNHFLILLALDLTSGVTERFSFFGLVYFTYYNDRKVHPHCSVVRITDFEGLNHIPLRVYHSLFMELAAMDT